MARILHRLRRYCTFRAIAVLYVLVRDTSGGLIIPGSWVRAPPAPPADYCSLTRHFTLDRGGRHPRPTRSPGRCSGTRLDPGSPPSLRLLLVDRGQNRPYLIGLGLAVAVLNVHARVAGPRGLEHRVRSARPAGRTEVVFADLVEIVVADVLRALFGVCHDADGRTDVPRAVPSASSRRPPKASPSRASAAAVRRRLPQRHLARTVICTEEGP